MSTKIAWTGDVWNVTSGCEKILSGCTNCYAERMHKRLQAMGSKKYQHDFNKVACHPDALDKSFGHKPKMIFVDSMSDLFHKDVPDAFIKDVYLKMAQTRGQGHKFQILTKRPERMCDLLNKWISDGLTFYEGCTGRLPSFIWHGTSVSMQSELDKAVPYLLKTPAAVRFLSLEPLLGEMEIWKSIYKSDPDDYNYCSNCGYYGNECDVVCDDCGDKENFDFNNEICRECGHKYYQTACPKCGTKRVDENNNFTSLDEFYPEYRPMPGIDWVIIGAESKGNYPGRECKIEWVRSISQQCQDANVPVFIKQLHIDGNLVKDVNQFPEDLRLQQYPEEK